MIRVRIWISGVPGIGHALLIEREQAPQECYALGNPPSRNARLGAAYSGDFEGHAGTYVDLPRGFPGDNATAAQRLNDPSIPQVIQQLIRESFPLRPRVRLVSRPRPAPQPRPVAQPQLIAQPQMVAQPQSVAQPQPVAQPPVAQLSRPADILAEHIRKSRMQDQTSHAG